MFALFPNSSCHPSWPPAELPAAQQDAPAGGLTTGGLPPSVVEVQAAGSSCDASTSCSSLLLLSSGHGDVMLAVRRADGDPAAAGPCALSAPAFPLRPAPPLRGVRPVHLAAAFLLPTSFAVDPPAAADVCCILWAPRPRSERQPSRCEVYAVRLAAEAGATPRLAVREVQLLKVRHMSRAAIGHWHCPHMPHIHMPLPPAPCHPLLRSPRCPTCLRTAC